jgi:hypothetical protein
LPEALGDGVILEAHRLRIELPARWSGRVFRRVGGNATLHAGDFPLALTDGEFGDRSTSVMPGQASFIALTEYVPGSGLQPGTGLFTAHGIPAPLDPTGFAATRLAHPRTGQVGMQHFFTASGRPLCLYVVVSGGRRPRRHQLLGLDRVLASLRISPVV